LIHPYFGIGYTGINPVQGRGILSSSSSIVPSLIGQPRQYVVYRVQFGYPRERACGPDSAYFTLVPFQLARTSTQYLYHSYSPNSIHQGGCYMKVTGLNANPWREQYPWVNND
jgi:hypothetical protein